MQILTKKQALEMYLKSKEHKNPTYLKLAINISILMVL